MSFHHESDNRRVVRRQASSRWAYGDVSLIELDVSYLPQICSLEKRCYTHPWSDTLIAGEFSKSVSVRLGLVQEQSLIGYAFSYLVGDELHILNVAIRPESQGSGYGKALLSSLLAQTYDRGARYATLEVRQSNSVAQSLYERVGFGVVGVRKHYYRNNREDALVLETSLTDAKMANIQRHSIYKSAGQKARLF